MKSAYCVVYITAPVGATARKIADRILKSRSAACVNIIPKIFSSYWWKGKLEKDAESLLIVKTRKNRVGKLQKEVLRIHPYSVPEIISLPIMSGNKPYLRWLHAETR